MNYGRHETRKKLRNANSKSKKYASKFFLLFFHSCFFLFIFGCIVAASTSIGMVMGIIDSAPEVNIESIVPIGYATTIYDRDGNTTDTLVTAGSNREEVTYDELPQDLIDAFVAIEDSRFWSHNGIDIRSITRAALGVLSGDNKGGGSTITQQLIKNNVFSGGMEKSFGTRLERKLQEQYLAVQLTKSMDRTLILTNYLNTINLGNNTLGVKVAARRYFNKSVSDLTLSECTVIAGITQNPSYYNPISESGHNEEKRRVILQYMYDQDYITKEEQDEALADDVYSRIQNNDMVTKESVSPYSYFTDELITQVKNALMEKLGYSETQAHNLLYSGGLSIHTTQDPTIQTIVDEEISRPENYSAARYSLELRLSVTHADGNTKHYSEENIKTWHQQVLQDSFDALYDSEESVQADIDAYKASLLQEGDSIIGERISTTLQPQASFVIMDHTTGQVKAISGGRGTKTESLTLNRATNTKRQPGSTFKVLTAFAPAIDTCNSTLGTVYYDTVYTDSVSSKTFSNWYSQGYMGYSSIRDGIIYSMNIIAVRCLMETVKPQLGIEYAKNFGITSLTSTDVNAAMVLGGLTTGVSNLELNGAYASIANGGVYTKPVFFTKILDHNGKVLINNEPETHRVLKDSTAFLLTDAMAASMESTRKFGSSLGPTSAAANIPGMSNAGKSGTTTSNNDIWFSGFTPYYTATIWGGCDRNQNLTAQNGGTSFHKKIWRTIMTRVHEGMTDPGFPVPDSVETADICRKSGKLAISGVCELDPRGSAVYTEYFATGTVPVEPCSNHVSIPICTQYALRAAEFCPEKSTKICMSLPSGETGATNDSPYAIPAYCHYHTSTGAIIKPTNEDDQGTSFNGPGATNRPNTGTAPSYQAPGENNNTGGVHPGMAPSSNPAPTKPSVIINPIPIN